MQGDPSLFSLLTASCVAIWCNTSVDHCCSRWTILAELILHLENVRLCLVIVYKSMQPLLEQWWMVTVAQRLASLVTMNRPPYWCGHSRFSLRRPLMPLCDDVCLFYSLNSMILTHGHSLGRLHSRNR